MTFDARTKSSAPTSGKQNALFAVATLTVVCGAFFTVLLMPHSGSKAPAPLVSAPADVQSVKAAPMPRLPGENAEAYYAALGRIDAKAQAALQAKIARKGKADAGELSELIFEHAGDVLKAHAGELAMADTRHLDKLLDLARTDLRTASRKRNKWCDAARYAGLQKIEFQDPAQVKAELAELEAPMREFGFRALTGLMDAIEDARAHPVTRGELTRADEAAMQGMVMSIMADPDMMPVLASLQSGADAEKTLKGVNVCDLGATALTAVKTLPQDTKGRLLAEAMRNMEKNGPTAFRSGVSF